MKNRIPCFLLIFFVSTLFTFAQTQAEKDFVAQIKNNATQNGWEDTQKKMKDFAVSQYQKRSYVNAMKYYYLYLWALVLKSKTDLLSDGLLDYVLINNAFSESFWNNLSPSDDFPKVMEILNNLYASDPASFKQYSELALAIALVYDKQPSSSDWPHYQIGSQARDSIPKTLPDPVKVFQFFVERNKNNSVTIRSDRLSASELKYVVDITASFDELIWVGKKINLNLNRLDSIYQGVVYDHPRLKEGGVGAGRWVDDNYKLDNILKKGGICIDQAYFTTQACKGRGVPSILVSGSGRDGYHAWVGAYKHGNWDFSTGRYSSENFVAGTAFDPQTWEKKTDHAIDYSIEAFRKTDNHRLALVHIAFAKIYMNEKNESQAAVAAQEATRLSSFYDEAWRTYIFVLEKNASKKEEALSAAIAALMKYPEVQNEFVVGLSDFYKDRGENEKAYELQMRLAKRISDKRSDLSIEMAKETLADVVNEKGYQEGFAEYKRMFTRFKDANGTALFNNIVLPFVANAMNNDEKKIAQQALKFAKDKLNFTQGSQLEAQYYSVLQKVDPDAFKREVKKR